ncbi:MAG TPA: hypothetical protein DEP46_18950 [Blastocatellia bacterium]|nr:hypothetical protein [Blastocatellia bacterium]
MKKVAILFLLVMAASTVLVAADRASIKEAHLETLEQDNCGRRGRGRGRDDSNSNSNRSGGSVASGEARNVALKAVPGDIIKEEFERENGRAVYEFYIRKTNGSVFEVYVDAETLKVVKIERR